MGFLANIIKSVCLALYQSFNASIVLAVLFMFVYIFARDYGVKEAAKLWIKNFKEDKKFVRVFLLVFYISMMLFRTVLARSYWSSPLMNVLGVWGLYDKSGNIYTENIENLMLFIPFGFLLLWAFRDRLFSTVEFTFKNLALGMLVMSSVFSVVIEMCQLMLKLGTVQISDVFFNTFGGFIGGIIYYLIYLKKKS